MLPQGFGSFPSVLSRARCRNLVLVECFYNGVWFLSYWRPMSLWVMGVGFGNTCTVSVVELRVPSGGTPTQRVPNWWLCLRILNQENPNLNSMSVQLSILALWNLCSESVRAWNFEILVEDSNTGGPSSIAVRIESLFAIFVPVPIWELCMKNDESEAESIIKWGGWGGSSLNGKNKEKFMTHSKFNS